MNAPDYDVGEITRALRLVAEAMDRWAGTADETSRVFQQIVDALDDEETDDTETWCAVRDAVALADSEGGWAHLRMRDDLVGALAGIAEPLPLTGPDNGDGSLMEVPQMHDLVPGEDCDDE